MENCRKLFYFILFFFALRTSFATTEQLHVFFYSLWFHTKQTNLITKWKTTTSRVRNYLNINVISNWMKRNDIVASQLPRKERQNSKKLDNGIFFIPKSISYFSFSRINLFVKVENKNGIKKLIHTRFWFRI